MSKKNNFYHKTKSKIMTPIKNYRKNKTIIDPNTEVVRNLPIQNILDNPHQYRLKSRRPIWNGNNYEWCRSNGIRTGHVGFKDMLYKSETSNSGNSPNGDWGDPTRLYDDVEQYHQ
ncbi:hypothetical protein QTP88_015992 [Uroleucon formosanum]